jgi:hypothetical protein
MMEEKKSIVKLRLADRWSSLQEQYVPEILLQLL